MNKAQQLQQKSHLKTGLFVLSGIVVLFAAVYILGSRKVFTDKMYLSVEMPQVQGLGVGSNVSLSGVLVGSVSEINFTDEGKSVRVTVAISKDYQKQLTEGTTAEIRTSGALGDKFIYIDPNSESTSYLKSGDQLTLKTTPDLLDVLSKRGGEAQKIFDILEEVKSFSKDLNRDQRVSAILENLKVASENIKATSEQTQKASVKVNNIIDKIDKGDGTIGALINDPSIYQNIKSLFGDSSRKQKYKDLFRQTTQEQ